MVVFIGNLPKQAAEKDLCQLAHIPPGTPLRVIKKAGRDGEVIRFALVPVTGDSYAHRLIKRMQGLQWHGHRLSAHDYQHRTAANERRRVDWRGQTWGQLERRQAERRLALAAAPISRVA